MPSIAICIPARDEAGELPGLFSSLERLRVDVGTTVRVCVLLDDCRDASGALADAYRRSSRHAVDVRRAAAATANAGRARRQVLAMALAALVPPDALLLTTDADSRPAPDWLVAMTAALRQADVVAGRIERCGGRPNYIQDRLDRYYDALFSLRRRLDPVPWEAEATHHHVGGANLGCRADAYLALGGFAPIAAGEDARLVDDAARAGFRVRRDAACLVHTSDRRQGRADHGLAASLRALDAGEAGSVTTIHPADAAWQYRLHALSRAAFARGRVEEAAPALGLTADHVRGVARDCPNAEAFAMRVVPVAPGGMREVSLPAAEVELERLLSCRRAA